MFRRLAAILEEFSQICFQKCGWLFCGVNQWIWNNINHVLPSFLFMTSMTLNWKNSPGFLLYSHMTTTLPALQTPRGSVFGTILWHQLGVPQSSSIQTLTKLAQTPQSSVPWDCPLLQTQLKIVDPQITHDFYLTWLQIRGSYNSPSWIWPFSRTVHRIQGNTYLCLLVYHITKNTTRLQMNSEMKRHIGQGQGPEHRTFCPSVVGMHQPPSTGTCSSTRGSSNPIPLGFLGGA